MLKKIKDWYPPFFSAKRWGLVSIESINHRIVRRGGFAWKETQAIVVLRNGNRFQTTATEGSHHIRFLGGHV